MKLVRHGEIVPDVFRLILAQIRSKRETAGDFRAQIASNNTGVRRLTDLVGRMGLGVVDAYVRELIAYTERRTRAEAAKLPRGVFRSEGLVDNDGFTEDPVRLVAEVTIDDDGVLFDLTGCNPLVCTFEAHRKPSIPGLWHAGKYISLAGPCPDS